MSKEIDINDEEQILKECDFDYFYNSEKCSRELCMFFNDIAQNEDFDKRQAYIDLGRIGITLNEQGEKIKDLEHRLSNCIEPKFKIGDKVWAIYWQDFLGEKYNYEIVSGKIDHLFIDRDNQISYGTMSQSFREQNLFATEEEARAKLEEMNNG